MWRICPYFFLFSSSSHIFWGFCLCCLWLVLLVALASALGLVSLWVVVVSFSLSDYTQKERARRVGASSLVLLWVALFGCCFIFLVLVRCQPVYIVIKFEGKVIYPSAVNFFALACVPACVVVNLSCFTFHISCL